MTMARQLLPWSIGMVAVGAAYELLVALGVIGLGPEPGDAPAGATAIVPLALLALLLVGGLLLAAAMGRRRWSRWGRLAVPAAGAAAAAFLVARFYSYDPYYAPYLRRMSEDGLVAGRWIAFLVAATLASGLLVRRWPRAAAAGTAVGVWAIALTAAVAGLGH
ncbi:MAG TPA: hypothetical protein VJN72_06985 [Gaiellales bacterium]|nr:hypothetical protein [Gaiellales bacterium]